MEILKGDREKKEELSGEEGKMNVGKVKREATFKVEVK